MIRAMLAMVVAGALAGGLPGSTPVAQAGAGGSIRVATLAPRTSAFARSLLKLNADMKKHTGGKWKVKLYPSGSAGDETDTLRKIRAGQLDATIVTSVGLSQVLKELAILTTPGVVKDYTALERIQKAFNPEWEKKLAEKQYRLMGWGEIGMLRYFSKAKLSTPMDLKNLRPWIYPASHTMKSTMKAIGATGTPLGIKEVYGGLQTGMIDVVISTALAVVALQWHTNITHVTLDTHGPLVGGMIMSNKSWGNLPPDVQAFVNKQLQANYRESNLKIRKQDKSALKKLLKRGKIGTKYTAQGKKDLKTIETKARQLLVGRVYSQQLLDRVLKVAAGG